MGYRRAPDILENKTLSEAFYDLRSEYNGARQTRYERQRRGVSSTGRTADYHFGSEGQFLRRIELARDYDANDLVVGQGVSRLTANILQGGFTLDPETGDKGLDQANLNRWNAWADDADQCDVSGESDWQAIEQLAFRQCIVDGDIFVLPTRSGALELVESHRGRTPSNTTRNVVLGVLLDGVRRPIEYWFTKEDVGMRASVAKVSDIQAYPARDAANERAVFHIFNRKRVSQTRGLTAFCPIVSAIGIHDDLQFAQLVKAQMAACWAIIEEQTQIASPLAPPILTGEISQETLGDGTTRTVQGVAPGMRVRGAPGMKLTGFAPNIPNPEFFPHATLILTFIAINLGLPVQMLLLDPKATNFSGWRGAMDQARIGFRAQQRWLCTVLHRRVYRWKVRQWMAEDGTMRALAEAGKVNPFGHRWHFPRWPYIEPMSDASADLLRMRNLLASPTMVSNERGDEWEMIVAQTVRDNAAAIRSAKTEAAKINAEFPNDDAPVTWAHVLSIPTPDRVSASMIVSPEKQPEPAAAEGSKSKTGGSADGN